AGARTTGSHRLVPLGARSDGAAIRRARHVVQPGALEEVDRVGIAAVLAADPQLQPGRDLASEPPGHLHELSDTRRVERLERRAVEDLAIDVARQDLAL